jgi:hypothetical protein
MGKPLGKSLLLKPRRELEDTFKMDLKRGGLCGLGVGGWVSGTGSGLFEMAGFVISCVEASAFATIEFVEGKR